MYIVYEACTYVHAVWGCVNVRTTLLCCLYPSWPLSDMICCGLSQLSDEESGEMLVGLFEVGPKTPETVSFKVTGKRKMMV